MKLKFLNDAYYDANTSYKKGEVYDIDNSKGHANRWLTRRLAIEVGEDVELEKEIKAKFEQKKVEIIPEEEIAEISEEVFNEEAKEEVVDEVEVKVKPKKNKNKNKAEEAL